MNKDERKGFEGNPELSQDAKDALNQDMKSSKSLAERIPQPFRVLIGSAIVGTIILLTGIVVKTVIYLFMLGYNIY